MDRQAYISPAFEDVVRHTDYFVVDNALNPNMTLTADQGVSVDIVQQQQSGEVSTIVSNLVDTSNRCHNLHHSARQCHACSQSCRKWRLR